MTNEKLLELMRDVRILCPGLTTFSTEYDGSGDEANMELTQIDDAMVHEFFLTIGADEAVSEEIGDKLHEIADELVTRHGHDGIGNDSGGRVTIDVNLVTGEYTMDVGYYVTTLEEDGIESGNLLHDAVEDVA